METLDRKKFVSDTLFVSLPSLAALLSGFVIMIFLTKFIGAEGFGVWTQFQATFSLVNFFLSLNFGRSFPRFLAGAKEKDYLAKVFYSSTASVLILTLIVALFFFFFRGLLADFLFGQKEWTGIIIFFVIYLIFKNISNQGEHFLMARRYAKEWTFISLTIFGLTTAAVSLTAVLAGNITAAIAALVAVEGLSLAIFLGIIWQKGIRPIKPDFNSLTPLLKFGLPLIIANIGYWVIQSSDRYFIKYFLDIYQVGLYSVGYSYAFILIFFWNALRGVLLPDLAVLFDEGKTGEFEIRFSRVLKYGVALSLPGVVGLAILAKPIIRIFSSAEFLASSNVLIVVASGVFFFGMFLLFTTLLSVLKNVRLLNLLWVLMALLNIGLNLWLIPWFGIMGAAWATSLSFLAGALLTIFYSRNYFKIIFKKEWLVKIIMAATFMSVVVKFMPAVSAPYLIFTVLAGAAVYGFSLWLLKFYDQSELLLIKKAWLK